MPFNRYVRSVWFGSDHSDQLYFSILECSLSLSLGSNTVQEWESSANKRRNNNGELPLVSCLFVIILYDYQRYQCLTSANFATFIIIVGNTFWKCIPMLMPINKMASDPHTRTHRHSSDFLFAFSHRIFHH